MGQWTIKEDVMIVDKQELARRQQKQRIVSYILTVAGGLIFIHLAMVFNLFGVIKSIM